MRNTCKKGKCNKHVNYCRFCENCNNNCQYFKEDICHKLTTSPYLCNGCNDKNKSSLTKKFYSAKVAQKDYEEILVDSRVGIESSTEEIKMIDDIITPLVNQGQSIHHIYANNKDVIMISEKTLYKYIDNGTLFVNHIDLPRKVK